MLLACPALAGAESITEAQQLAAAVEQRAVNTSNLQAEFIRHSGYVAIGNDGASQVLATGRLYWAEPVSLRLEQETPSQELIVADGKSVWWVRPERSRADVYPIGDFTASLRSLLDVLGGLSGISKDFDVIASTDEDQSDQPGEVTLVLKPKQPRTELSRLVLWLDRESLIPQGFRFSNLVGDTTQYRFTKIEVNQSLSKDLFRYQPPADYRVNDQR